MSYLIVVGFLVVLIVAVVVAVVVTRQHVVGRYAALVASAEKENEMLRHQAGEAERRHADAEQRRAAEASERLARQHDEAERRIAALTADFDRREAALRSDYERRAQQMADELRQQSERQAALLKAQVETATQQLLERRAEQLQAGNQKQMEGVVGPLAEQLKAVQTAISQSRETSAAGAARIETAIRGIVEQSQRLGEDASRLTAALQNKSKVQGDWGEQILEQILEESGLRRDHDYEVQASFAADAQAADETGAQRFRPDVVVHCPGGRNIIIDSKVSLTAYVRYVGADSDEERASAERENYDSMLAHVNELAEKQYHRLVPGSLPTVLMFVPNEGSYILALRHNPQLGQIAFRKGVVIINPTNLMLSLQLIYNLWQSERQTRGVENIIRQSTALYEKFVTFADTFLSVGDTIGKAQAAWQKAEVQLSTGRGNIVRRLEELKKLGITTQKQMPDRLTDTADALPEGDADE